MDLLLKIKEFLTEAKAAGTYQGEINITILEQYAEEVFHNNYKSLEKLIPSTLSVELHNNLVEKLNNIKAEKLDKKKDNFKLGGWLLLALIGGMFFGSTLCFYQAYNKEYNQRLSLQEELRAERDYATHCNLMIDGLEVENITLKNEKVELEEQIEQLQLTIKKITKNK